jgi:hypothetical protein
VTDLAGFGGLVVTQGGTKVHRATVLIETENVKIWRMDCEPTVLGVFRLAHMVSAGGASACIYLYPSGAPGGPTLVGIPGEWNDISVASEDGKMFVIVAYRDEPFAQADATEDGIDRLRGLLREDRGGDAPLGVQGFA